MGLNYILRDPSWGTWTLWLWHAGSVAAVHRLSSCGAWALEHTGSVVVAHGFSSCGMCTPALVGSIVAVQGLISLWHVGS